MSIALMNAVWDSGPDGQAETYVLLAIADNASPNGIAYPGLPLIAQGWLFGYPVPAEEFHYRWLRTRNALADETEVVAATQHQIS